MFGWIRWRRRLLFLAVLAAAGLGLAGIASEKPLPARNFTIPGFTIPESVVADPGNDVWYVSNIGAGGEVASGEIRADNNGFISRVSRSNGKILNLKWAAGGENGVNLDSPHGLGIFSSTLYAADLTRIRRFDLKTGKQLDSVEVPGSTFLNDVAVDSSGNVYVSDSGFASPSGNDLKVTGTDAIWKLDTKGKLTRFASGVWLENPNGLVARPNGDIWVASYSINQSDPGQVFVLDSSGKKKDTITLPHGLLDGLAAVGDDIIASSQVGKGNVYSKRLPGGVPVIIFPDKIFCDLTYDEGSVVMLSIDSQLLVRPYIPNR